MLTRTSDFTICALYMFKDNFRDSNPDDETMHTAQPGALPPCTTHILPGFIRIFLVNNMV